MGTATAIGPQFEIRAALPTDEDELFALAGHLNSVNLPAERAAIRKLLAHSQGSFDGSILRAEKRRYTFLLRDRHANRAVGTSTLIAQLGQPDAPYIYFDVFPEEKYSRDLDLHFDHRALRIGFSYDGPTELGGLVVDPEYRQRPGRLGLSISYVRFLFVAANPHLFQPELLAELLPPLEPDGTSHLWNALGRRFTNMTYREADRLSHDNKDFIRDLFPNGPVYASVLDEAAQGVIGKVGQQTRGVEKMLTRIGFRYADRVDPFDGGPHFTAKTKDVTTIQQYRTLPVEAASDARKTGSRVLLARLTDRAPYLRAVATTVQLGADVGYAPIEAINLLGLTPGAAAHCIPLT